MIIKEALFAGSSQRTDQKPKAVHPEFAFIGRSNVGKSSLINRLCGKKGLAHTSSTPGKTQLVNHFLINNAWYLVDLPGYGYAKMGHKGREKLQDIIGDYILNSEDLVLLFVLLDSRHDLQQIDRDFINELGERSIPFALIYTKCDKLGPVALQRQVEHNAAILLENWDELPPTFCSSAETGKGREEILNYIETILNNL
ncbi:MAG: YihA family ribosome biogenesis GTP-binding protein [Bacteroidales bacterium]|nr:YihA family ribosome biogenesis GTP-binding protein [Bacteroidales bacterium]MBQ2599421.1 YihA family ribosome biogenesis GTP-binding protein [Bacteroidales bacterium]